MTDSVECPICEFVVEIVTPNNDQMGLLGVMGLVPSGMSVAQAEVVETQLFDHLTEHTVLEWVQAMRQADVYIEQLENEAETLKAGFASLQAERDALRSRPASVQRPAGPPVPYDAHYDDLSPRERQERLAADRKAGLTQAVKDTLIPIIPTAQRAEGQVGRRV